MSNTNTFQRMKVLWLNSCWFVLTYHIYSDKLMAKRESYELFFKKYFSFVRDASWQSVQSFAQLSTSHISRLFSAVVYLVRAKKNTTKVSNKDWKSVTALFWMQVLRETWNRHECGWILYFWCFFFFFVNFFLKEEYRSLLKCSFRLHVVHCYGLLSCFYSVLKMLI